VRFTRLPVAAAAVAALAAPVFAPDRASACGAGVAPTEEAGLVKLVNDIRISNGLSRLKTRVLLRSSARRHSATMASSGKLEHQVRDGRLTWAPVGAAAGENVALAGGSGEALQLMLGSPPHRQNLMMANWRSIGIGAVTSCSGVFFTLEFLG
jgi:uncharacterized protein YkwD